MAQFGRPDADVTNTGNGGFADIDEASPSDADFWFGDNNQADELEVSLSNVTDPASSADHVFRYRIAKTNAGTVSGTGNAVTVTARLMQGTTEIATDTAKTADGTWTQYAFTLSGAEADAITDYTDLRLEFVTSASGGSPANRRGGAVSWAELEVPNAAVTVLGEAGAATASALIPTPEVHIPTDASIATGSAPTPVIDIQAGGTTVVDIDGAEAAASAPVPTVVERLEPGAQEATVSAPTPTIVELLEPAAGASTASGPTPVLILTVPSEIGIATLSAPIPTLLETIGPDAATATMSAPIPTIDDGSGPVYPSTDVTMRGI